MKMVSEALRKKRFKKSPKRKKRSLQETKRKRGVARKGIRKNIKRSASQPLVERFKKIANIIK